ncbi:MAG: zinc dependent phospholipase C family protein [Gemmatimonadetes bacterium]|nr:zinc dependent phospholipase C family protein [Gemmatimonadota bacterium]MBT6146781.1 zinc dependent phospholipase C family protein [Gemmatimonadota bacterium]MBT7860097.1 zinc dependent phospholipase C family protein [Gemmatimonadota bacterium]
MAGTYLHLLLAQQALEGLAERTDLSEEQASFYAGVVGPDIGFFPGGPRQLSDAIHRQHSADLIRALVAQAQNPAERAFAAGWALHVYTDLAVHPVIDELSFRLQADHPLAAGADVWHRRIEWGLDCQVLESTALRLWQFPLSFPFEPSAASVLERAAKPLYGSLVDTQAIHAGGQAAALWIRRLVPALLWTGGCRRSDCSLICRLAGAVANPFARALSSFWEQSEGRDDEVAILGPRRNEDELTHRLRTLASESIDAFRDGLRQEYRQLANRNLSTGELTHPNEDES